MTDERKTIVDYSPETYERVRQALLHVATVLGDWMEQVTLIGGIVPSLLVPPLLLASPFASALFLCLLIPIHFFVFRGMARGIVRWAEQQEAHGGGGAQSLSSTHISTTLPR